MNKVIDIFAERRKDQNKKILTIFNEVVNFICSYGNEEFQNGSFDVREDSFEFFLKVNGNNDYSATIIDIGNFLNPYFYNVSVGDKESVRQLSMSEKGESA